MMKITASEKIYLAESEISGAGRGVFAKVDIKKGEIIERCPFIEIPAGDTSKLNESFLVTYFFYFGKEKEQIALALGFGSLYNHSSKPIAKYEILSNQMIIKFSALKDIGRDEEITINYASGSKNNIPVWVE
jgi:uncharacterized protein